MIGSVFHSTVPQVAQATATATAERHFDLYVEPVSTLNLIYLIVMYGVKIHTKFCGKFVKSNKMTPVHEMSRTGDLSSS